MSQCICVRKMTACGLDY